MCGGVGEADEGWVEGSYAENDCSGSHGTMLDVSNEWRRVLGGPVTSIDLPERKMSPTSNVKESKSKPSLKEVIKPRPSLKDVKPKLSMKGQDKENKTEEAVKGESVTLQGCFSNSCQSERGYRAAVLPGRGRLVSDHGCQGEWEAKDVYFPRSNPRSAVYAQTCSDSNVHETHPRSRGAQHRFNRLWYHFPQDTWFPARSAIPAPKRRLGPCLCPRSRGFRRGECQ